MARGSSDWPSQKSAWRRTSASRDSRSRRTSQCGAAVELREGEDGLLAHLGVALVEIGSA
jgi:hypothetical protein